MVPKGSGRLRVLYLNPVSWIGGAEGALYDLVTNVDLQRVEPVVVLPGNGHLPDMLRAASVRTHVVPFYGTRARNPLRFFQTLWLLRRIVRQEATSVIHVNQQHFSNYGVLLARMCRLPLIVHLRGVETDEFLSGAVKWMARANRIICVSHAAQSRLLEYAAAHASVGTTQVLSKRSVVVHDGLRPVSFLSRRQARAEFGLADDTRVVGIVGQVVPEKGLMEFVEAASIVRDRHPGTCFYVIGEDPDRSRRYEQQVKREVEGRGLQHYFNFTGFRVDAAALLPLLDVSVLASWRDAFPRVVLESLAAGVPMVATHVGGVPEMIEDGVSGLLVEPRNAEALADGIVKVLTMDRAVLHRVVERGRHAAAQHTIESHVTKVCAIYDELSATR